jgi:DNA-directed RNA polymerase specialized sigma24 family protein
MSRPRAPPPKIVQQPEPEEEEEEDEDEEMDFEDGMDMFEALGSLLATEEGETIATALVSLKDAAEKIALNLEMHNKLMVKIAAALNKMVPAPPAVVDSA